MFTPLSIGISAGVIPVKVDAVIVPSVGGSNSTAYSANTISRVCGGISFLSWLSVLSPRDCSPWLDTFILAKNALFRSRFCTANSAGFTTAGCDTPQDSCSVRALAIPRLCTLAQKRLMSAALPPQFERDLGLAVDVGFEHNRHQLVLEREPAQVVAYQQLGA